MSSKDIIVPVDENLRIRIEETATRTVMHFEGYQDDRWTDGGELRFDGTALMVQWLPALANALNRLEKLMLLK